MNFGAINYKNAPFVLIIENIYFFKKEVKK